MWFTVRFSLTEKQVKTRKDFKTGTDYVNVQFDSAAEDVNVCSFLSDIWRKSYLQIYYFFLFLSLLQMEKSFLV